MQGCALASLQWSNYRCKDLKLQWSNIGIDWRKWIITSLILYFIFYFLFFFACTCLFWLSLICNIHSPTFLSFKSLLLAMILFRDVEWRVLDFRDARWHHWKFKDVRRWHQNFENLRWSNSKERQFSPNFRDARKCHQAFEDARRYHQVFEDEKRHYADFRYVRQHNLEGRQWNSKERRCNTNFDNARWMTLKGCNLDLKDARRYHQVFEDARRYIPLRL